MTDPSVRELLKMLERAPGVPIDIALFTSETLFGQPGIYPEGPPMSPAGVAHDDVWILGELDRVLATIPDPSLRTAARERFDDPHVVMSVPDAGVRAGLVILAGTCAAPLLDVFGDEASVVKLLSYGEPASSGRVVGPPAGEAKGLRVVNDRYRSEHPALVAPSLAHDLLWDPTLTAHDPETILHAVAAMVHLQLLARCPWLGALGTELARRQNSLAITLCNSRRKGSAQISLFAPDGAGTIPGGDPRMQTPDFWSVPFGPPGDSDAPAHMARVVDALGPGASPPDPLRFDRGLAEWLDARAWAAWLPPQDHVRAAVALGLLSAPD